MTRALTGPGPGNSQSIPTTRTPREPLLRCQPFANLATARFDSDQLPQKTRTSGFPSRLDERTVCWWVSVMTKFETPSKTSETVTLIVYTALLPIASIALTVTT